MPPAYPSSLVPLSFRLHADLAAEHGGAARWGYRRVGVGSITCQGRAVPSSAAPGADARKADSVSLGKRGSSDGDAKALKAAGLPDDLDWIVPAAARAYSPMGSPADTAQVHPFQFTTAMAALAQERGARVELGAAVTELVRGADGKHMVRYTDSSGAAQELSATDVVVCAGPWARNVLPQAPISAMRAHSVTIRTTRPVSAYALFTEIALPGRKGAAKSASPEIYARPDGEVYACGEGDRLVPLPATSREVAVDPQRCQDIVEQVGSISDEIRDGEVTAQQACYLPSNDAGGSAPLVGPTGVKGVWLAAGHTCWGIQNGPGTGKVMSEWIMDGAVKCAKVGALDPRRML